LGVKEAGYKEGVISISVESHGAKLNIFSELPQYRDELGFENLKINFRSPSKL
jgi:hypothetical protein